MARRIASLALLLAFALVRAAGAECAMSSVQQPVAPAPMAMHHHAHATSPDHHAPHPLAADCAAAMGCASAVASPPSPVVTTSRGDAPAVAAHDEHACRTPFLPADPPPPRPAVPA